jgi:hypothetical protein
MRVFKLVVVLFSLTVTNVLFAKSSRDEKLVITPIIGLERIQKLQPTVSMKTRTVFGARATYKLPITSAEAEYTHGQDSSYDAITTTTYKDVGDKIKLGLVGSASLGEYLTTFLRGGAQAGQTTLTKTVSGASSISTTTTKVNPYLGTGLSIHLMQVFSLTADVTAVYKPTSTPGLSDYEITPSLGFSLSI